MSPATRDTWIFLLAGGLACAAVLVAFVLVIQPPRAPAQPALCR